LEVFVSTNERVRIVKVLNVSTESKAWHADPDNRICDAPGSWYCPGQLSPGLRELFDEKKILAGKSGLEAAAYKKAFSSRVWEQHQALPKPNGEGIPEGSYLGSCRGCSMEGSKLICTHCEVAGS